MTSWKSTPDPPPGETSDERRQWRRAGAEWPITIILDDGEHEARVRDVSSGGVCFFLDRPVREMTLLRIDFSLPVDKGIRHINGTGAVVRCERISEVLDHYEIAVFIQDMAAPDRKTIAEYVERWQTGRVG